MKITNWRGMAPRSTFSRSLDDFFNDRYRSLLGMDSDFSPAMNTKELKEGYDLELAVPGHKKEDLKVAVHDGVLTISAEHDSEKETDEDGYVRREFQYNGFSRSFTLPKDVDDEHISARCENGVLHLHLPRQVVPEENEAERRIVIGD